VEIHLKNKDNSMVLIKSGTLVTAEKTFKADVLMKDGIIEAISPELSIPDAEIMDAEGMLIMPGGVDPHTHFDLPMFNTVSSDDHYTGHKSAAFGGTTTVMDFVPQPENGSLADGVEAWHTKADPKAAIDFGFHMNITHLDEKIKAEIPNLLDLGIPTLKVFMAYNGVLRLQDREIFKVMQIAKENNMLTMLHAENGDVIDVLVEDAINAGQTQTEWHAKTRPAWGAVDAVLRGAALAAQADTALYIVHMNTSGGAEQLKYARERGVKVMGETCPQYLFFTADDLAGKDGAKWVCSPPLRTKTDIAALWQSLEDNQMQVMATDHCPFFFDGRQSIDYEGQQVAIPGKELGKDDFTKIPNGLPGVGDRLPILWTYGVGKGHITPNQFVALTSTNPAKIFGLYPKKGALEVGADADILVWDPEKEKTYGLAHSHHRTDYNLYEGWKLKGFPEKVYLRGNLIVDGEKWLGKAGMGNYLPRQSYAVI
jgi:dihydropyrimidinase